MLRKCSIILVAIADKNGFAMEQIFQVLDGAIQARSNGRTICILSFKNHDNIRRSLILGFSYITRVVIIL